MKRTAGFPVVRFLFLELGVYMVQDTIAGVSTAAGQAGIAIIRISGDQAFEIGGALFRGRVSVPDQKSHTLQYGKIVMPDSGEVIDEVLLTKMAAPRTYTREDIIEINCHGGHVVIGRILDLILSHGARLAEPGEFTKRAFLHGRMDLSQAEAVMDIIQARTQAGSKAAVRQLEGSLSVKLTALRSLLVDLLARLEVNLDYPEYDAEEVTALDAAATARKVLGEIENLIASFHYGKILREGLQVSIIGRPNVGKSSLMNRLSRKNRSIVTEIPGTTRDVIEENINIRGIPVVLSDTAGIRRTEDPVEKIGVERSDEAMRNADYVLLLLDASHPLTQDDQELMDRVQDSGSPYQLIFNKTDLVGDQQFLERLKAQYPTSLFMTLVRDDGTEQLEEALYKYANENAQNSDSTVLVTNARHVHQLKLARESLKAALQACLEHRTMDIVALELHKALEDIGAITGHHAGLSILEAVFSRFCLGK